MLRCLVLLLLLPLAGCLGSPEAAPLDAAEVPDPPAPVHVATAADAPEVVANVTVGGVTLVAEGAAGSFVVAYHPFPEVRKEREYEFDWAFDVDDEGAYAFWTDLTLVYADGDLGWFNPFETELLRTLDGGLHAAEEGGLRTSGPTGIAGLLFVAAADAPWRLQVEVRWGEGDLVQPAFLSSGDDALFGRGGEDVNPYGAGAGSITFEATVGEPGWTHVELLDDKLQPVGARQSEFRLPNGFEAGGVGYRHGYYVPFVGGSASSGNIIDYAGAPAGTAGDLSVTLDYAEASTGRGVAWMHLPGAELPDGMDGEGYAGSNWPFESPLDDD